MYLKNIKLAGFKSFVDPTTIPVRCQMNAIVGPNGCGKSNVVDAIRWVIGETSAKQLRGQSMSDVIFNGTTQRKPVGKAAVELMFDDCEGRINGEFSKYNQIAIRREVERDGQSGYFINGTHCRRRDIIDLFLGTGLGPRSYSIIEQGMVSQLIEAKPDDLRVYFEEAAGISKYKERRRETENRIKRTNENLDRLSDLSEELTKQQRHLKRQSNAAERYKVFKEEERLLQAQIKALHWQDLNQKLQVFDEKTKTEQLHYEKLQADLQGFETELEKGRIKQSELSENQNEIQKQYYGIGAKVARIEQEIKHTEDQIKQWQAELSQIQENWQELSDSTLEHQEQISQFSHEVETLAPQQNTIKEQAIVSKQHLAHAEETMRDWEQRFEQYQQQMAQLAQQIEVSRTNIDHYQNQLSQLQQRMARIEAQQDDSQIAQLSEEIEPLNVQVNHLDNQLAEIKTELETITSTIAQKRQVIATNKLELEQTRKQLQEKEAQFAKLNALQQSALEGDNQQTIEWLNRYQIADNQRLGKNLQVTQGWEVAVETVLSHYIDAVCVDNIDQFLDSCAQLSSGKITLIDRANDHYHSSAHKAQTLRSQVQSEWPTDAWLEGIYIADTIEQAKNLRQQLSATESVITQDGVWLGKHWVRIAKTTDDQGSVLLREKSIKALEIEISALKNTLEQQTQTLQSNENALAQFENNRESAQQRYQSISVELTQAQKAFSQKQSRLQQMQETQKRLKQEYAECENQKQQLANKLSQTQAQLNQDEQTQQQRLQTKQQIITERDQCRERLEASRAEANSDQQRADEFGIRLAANESQLNLLQQTVARTQRQMQQLETRRETITTQLNESEQPLQALSSQLQEELQSRVVIESKLTEAEQQLNAHQHHMRNTQSERNRLTETISELQIKLQNSQMEKQAIAVRQTTIEEQIVETDFQLQELIQEMPEEADLTIWEENAANLAQKITRLGPINLAAIEEYKTVTERKEYLEKQLADLHEALEVLQDAIKKIDRETKAKFKDTFDKVNAKFQEVFPRIFGGGRASLETTDDDILTTGIIVRAQPPGKRNSTIHMLSGGEKALTAIALIFGLFHLNPAPFCILDEVDAPLDDVNVGRFCTLVKEMSKQTQFIIISHNKVTISSADQLMGVTMQEAGVSRIVSVDVDAAMEMVEA